MDGSGSVSWERRMGDVTAARSCGDEANACEGWRCCLPRLLRSRLDLRPSLAAVDGLVSSSLMCSPTRTTLERRAEPRRLSRPGLPPFSAAIFEPIALTLAIRESMYEESASFSCAREAHTHGQIASGLSERSTP